MRNNPINPIYQIADWKTVVIEGVWLSKDTLRRQHHILHRGWNVYLSLELELEAYLEIMVGTRASFVYERTQLEIFRPQNQDLPQVPSPTCRGFGPVPKHKARLLLRLQVPREESQRRFYQKFQVLESFLGRLSTVEVPNSSLRKCVTKLNSNHK